MPRPVRSLSVLFVWATLVPGARAQQPAAATHPAGLRAARTMLAITPDGANIYVTQSRLGQLQIVDRQRLRPVQSLDTGGTPRRVAFDRLGTTAVVANEAGWVDFVR